MSLDYQALFFKKKYAGSFLSSFLQLNFFSDILVGLAK